MPQEKGTCEEKGNVPATTPEDSKENGAAKTKEEDSTSLKYICARMFIFTSMVSGGFVSSTATGALLETIPAVVTLCTAAPVLGPVVGVATMLPGVYAAEYVSSWLMGKVIGNKSPQTKINRQAFKDNQYCNGSKNGNDEFQRALCCVCSQSRACVQFRTCNDLATCSQCLDAMKRINWTKCPVCGDLFEQTEEISIT